jgi:hypothetical protein
MYGHGAESCGSPLLGYRFRMGNGCGKSDAPAAGAELLPMAQRITYHRRPRHHGTGLALVEVTTTAADA